MKIVEWVRSMVRGTSPSIDSEDFRLAKSFAPIAESFLVPLGVVGLNGPKWAIKEADFMAGYLQGYGDVIAQASGRESGSQLGANIALQFALKLMGAAEAPTKVVNAFIEFSASASGPIFDAGMARGSQDANSFATQQSTLAKALAEHLGID